MSARLDTVRFNTCKLLLSSISATKLSGSAKSSKKYLPVERLSGKRKPLVLSESVSPAFRAVIARLPSKMSVLS